MELAVIQRPDDVNVHQDGEVGDVTKVFFSYFIYLFIFGPVVMSVA